MLCSSAALSDCVELDSKEVMTVEVHCKELMHNYSIVLDTIQKNMEKIKKPRSSMNSHAFMN